MSSERAGGLNRDWPGRAEVFRSFNGELDQDIVDQLDRAHTPSERAGVQTGGALNREAATDVLKDTIGFQPNDAFLDALEACVVPDPRLGRIEAQLAAADGWTFAEGSLAPVLLRRLHAILRGDQ